MYHVGREQLIIFVSTILGVLATDLLVGIGIGILVKAVIHIVNGAPIASLLKANISVDTKNGTVSVEKAAIFSTWISLKSRIESLKGCPRVVVDLSKTALVDHTVMSNLEELSRELRESQRELIVSGLDDHEAISGHPQAARKSQRR